MMQPSAPVSMDDNGARANWFANACELVGGQRAMARLLAINERSVRFLAAGDRPVHDGFVADVVAVLRSHADACLEAATLTPP